jgi:GPH family glycoside/pentoside/hexuronide:cation symporter
MRDRRIGVATKVGFGTGQVAESIKMNSFDFFLLFYYVQVLHLNPAWVGSALLLALVVDAVTDPVFGAVSDNLNSRWGRRHPFMYISAVPFGLCFYFLFSPPTGLEDTQLLVWLIVFAVGTRLMMTLFLVPYYAVGAELTENYRERTALVAYRTMAGWLGAIVLTAVAFTVFFQPTAEYPQGQLNPAAYPLFGVTFGLMATFAILVATRGTQSQIPHLHRQTDGQANLGNPGYYLRELSKVLRNRSFLAIFLVSITFFIMLGVQRTLALHMNTYFWELETQTIQYLFYAFFVATLATVPLVKYLIDWLDKKNTLYLGLWVILIAFVVPTSLRLLEWFPANGSALLLPLLLFGQLGAGFGTGVLMVCSGSIVADVADDHELRCGKRQEGLLFGFFTLASKSTSGLGSFLAGMVLAYIAFPTELEVAPGDVAPETLFKLGLAFGPGVAIFGFLCVAVMSLYGINKASHEQTLKTLNQRRAEADSASD